MERATTNEFTEGCRDERLTLETLKMMHIEVLMMAQAILDRMRKSRKEDNRRRLQFDVASWIITDRL